MTAKIAAAPQRLQHAEGEARPPATSPSAPTPPTHDQHLCSRRDEGGCSKSKPGHAYPQRLCHIDADGNDRWYCHAHYPASATAAPLPT